MYITYCLLHKANIKKNTQTILITLLYLLLYLCQFNSIHWNGRQHIFRSEERIFRVKVVIVFSKTLLRLALYRTHKILDE